MSNSHSVELDTSDWVKRPGNVFEIKATLERLGIKEEEPGRLLDMAKEQMREAVTRMGEPEASEHFLMWGRVLLWVVASKGVEEACMMLAAEVDSYIRVTELNESVETVCKTISEHWKSCVTSPARVGRFKLRKRDPKMEADIQDLMQEIRHIPEEGCVVITAIGDDKSPEGVGIARRYGSLVGASLPSRITMPEKGYVQDVIARDWPWAVKVGNHIENMLAVQRSVGLTKPVLKPMLFVGPPGSGKTKLAMKVAELFEVPSVLVSAGSTGDSAGLASVTRGWAGSRPCGPVVAAMQFNCCDPAIIVDEVDKGVAAGSKNGSAVGTLLGMLGTPDRFQDTCLLSEVNLSKMIFMATSNSLSALSQPLLDRFSVMFVGRPHKKHFPIILKNMKASIASDFGVHPEMLPRLTADEYEVLQRQFVKGDGSLRDFSRALDFVLSQAAEREAVLSPHCIC